jgi:hypothetical protein
MKELVTIVAAFGVLAFTFWVGHNVGNFHTTRALQDEAVAKGFGEYCIEYDGQYENLHRVFRWKVKP